jgi:ubiquinone/menaquinone biosynthesis C-methylase UbiE
VAQSKKKQQSLMNMEVFKDNFSKQSDIYVRYRPHYPVDLYAHLSHLTENHELVWDCGTGNGQAAIGLSMFYHHIVATDPSEQQIKHAIQDEKVTYLVEKAERSSLKPESVDLVTIANALHWFDFDAFYTEVHRVLKPTGIVAAWAYGVPSISPEVNPIIHRFHYHTLDAYWQAENRLVEKDYTTIPFPFEEIKSPTFYYEKPMNLVELIGYLNTWSATQRFIEKNRFNPTEQVYNELKKVWPNDNMEKMLTWKLVLKVGRIAGNSLM